MRKFLLTIIAAVAAGAGSAYGVVRYYSLHEHPIAIISIGDYIKDGEGQISQGSINDGFKSSETMAQALAKKGYVVIDGQSVIAAPEEYYVRPTPKAAPKAP